MLHVVHASFKKYFAVLIKKIKIMTALTENHEQNVKQWINIISMIMKSNT